MSDKKNLQNAMEAKNDEFYTFYKDIEKEMNCYGKDVFANKTVYCNCDSKESNFYRYFKDNFNLLGLKKVMFTHFESNEIDSVLTVIDKDGEHDEHYFGDGGFQSEACIGFLSECDIVVTNPPFSLFREFMDKIMMLNKQFLVICNRNAITYKEIYKLIKENKLWLGYNYVKEFSQPDGSIKKFGNIGWFTNLPTDKRSAKIELRKDCDISSYDKYTNYDAIDVCKVKDIPDDYYGVMGVPITFLDKYNPEQFEIIGFRKGNDGKDLNVDGKSLYFRILIKRKQPL